MKKVNIAVAIALAMSTSVYAEPGKKGDTWVGGFIEYYDADDDKPEPQGFLDDGTGLGLEFGARISENWAARIEWSSLDIDARPIPGTSDQDGNRFGVDALRFFNDDAFYLFAGLKYQSVAGRYRTGNLGIGKHWNLNEKWRVISEAAAYHDFGQGFRDFGLKLGLAYRFGDDTGSPRPAKDSDNDGVNDNLDQCPNTPAGTQVDASGCNIDSDGDGVLNSADNCPNTPAGTKVDSYGCNQDLDGDGVINSMDKCPDTPAGTKVGAKGCSLELDSDQDGVLDSQDSCANTPITDKVDETGCSLFTEKEVSIDLRVLFANNSAVINNPEDEQFQKFADFMNRYPSTDTVIEGHASAPGDDGYNMQLSQERADSVRTLLINDYGINAERITAEGFGETQLLDDSNTEAAHKINRRITAKVAASDRVKVQK